MKFINLLLVFLFITFSFAEEKEKIVMFDATLKGEESEELIFENIPYEDGVLDLDVDAVNKTIRIKFDSEETDSDQLAYALKLLGFDTRTYYEIFEGEEEPELNIAEIWNVHCPIMKEDINPTARTVMYKGKRIGFCCDGCDVKFMKDPEKYMSLLNEKGELKEK